MQSTFAVDRLPFANKNQFHFLIVSFATQRNHLSVLTNASRCKKSIKAKKIFKKNEKPYQVKQRFFVQFWNP